MNFAFIEEEALVRLIVCIVAIEMCPPIKKMFTNETSSDSMILSKNVMIHLGKNLHLPVAFIIFPASLSTSFLRLGVFKFDQRIIKRTSKITNSASSWDSRFYFFFDCRKG